MDNNLLAIRKKKGLSGKELGARAGCSASHIWMIERGERLPSLPLALKICTILEVDLKDIFLELYIKI